MGPPQRRRKIPGKSGKSDEYYLLHLLSKIFAAIFANIFETVNLWVCQMTIIGGAVDKKLTIFKVYQRYLSEFLILLHEIFFT